MNKPKLRLVQVFPPLVGHLLVFTLEGAELGEVLSWRWMVEEGKGDKTLWKGVKGNASGLKIQATYLHKRIKAEVLLSGFRRLTAISYPVLSPEEYSKDISLENLKELFEAIGALIPDYKAASKELITKRQDFEKVNEIPQKLARMEKLALKLEAERQEIEKHRTLLVETREQLDRAWRVHQQIILDEREQIQATLLELEKKKEAFNADHVLQRLLEEKRQEIAEVRQLWERVENAWDVIDKARHLKVQLTHQNLEAIMAIIAAETQATRISRKIESLSDEENSKICHHYATKSSLEGWPRICSDCSK